MSFLSRKTKQLGATLTKGAAFPFSQEDFDCQVSLRFLLFQCVHALPGKAYLSKFKSSCGVTSNSIWAEQSV